MHVLALESIGDCTLHHVGGRVGLHICKKLYQLWGEIVQSATVQTHNMETIANITMVDDIDLVLSVGISVEEGCYFMMTAVSSVVEKLASCSYHIDRASSLYRDGDHSVNILVAPEQILQPL